MQNFAQRARKISQTLGITKPSVSTSDLDSTIYSAPHSRPNHQGGKPVNKEDIQYPLFDGDPDDPKLFPYAQVEARINAHHPPRNAHPSPPLLAAGPDAPLWTPKEFAGGSADNSARPVQFPRTDATATPHPPTSTDAHYKPLILPAVAPLNIRKINSIDNTRPAATTTTTVRHDTQARPPVSNQKLHKRSVSAQQLHTTSSRPQESRPRAVESTSKHHRAESEETSPPKSFNPVASVAAVAQSLLPGEATNKLHKPQRANSRDGMRSDGRATDKATAVPRTYQPPAGSSTTREAGHARSASAQQISQTQTSRTPRPHASPDVHCSTADATVRRQPAVKRSASSGGIATGSNTTAFAGGHHRTVTNIWADRQPRPLVASNTPPNVDPHTVPRDHGSGPSTRPPPEPARAHVPVSPQVRTTPPRGQTLPAPPSRRGIRHRHRRRR
ncbi:hypothetical protein B0H21DRAFT_104438, partial [Amylocystis lapponica]